MDKTRDDRISGGYGYQALVLPAIVYVSHVWIFFICSFISANVPCVIPTGFCFGDSFRLPVLRP